MVDDSIYDENGETEYMRLGWDNNVWNCNIPIERSVMISDSLDENEYDILQAGIILGELGVAEGQHEMHSCGKWWWIEFTEEEIALAFKLKWI